MTISSSGQFGSLIQSMFGLQSCLVCLQNSAQLICTYCQDDLETFNLDECGHNLLNWPSVRQALPQLQCDHFIALSDYQWPLSNLLVGLKFGQRVVFAKALAELFCRYMLTEQVLLPQAIIPVPLHINRFRQRKYNQALEIARHIASHTGLHLDYQLCRRIRATQPQTDLNGAQRRKNLHQAFVLNGQPSYQHVVIFDDIVTTGTTVNELARTLKQANPAMQIDIWSICVALPD
ncbi:ComF family protein [Neptunicella sp. SCSIO 80796]|uniref:ComF family protein n=1 Tax=Neptunicella plasticusilytica TaxID=3117012 RepID=UPI003A4DEB06